MVKHDQRLLIALVIIHVMLNYSHYVINVFTDPTLHRNMPDA